MTINIEYERRIAALNQSIVDTINKQNALLDKVNDGYVNRKLAVLSIEMHADILDYVAWVREHIASDAKGGAE